MKIVFAVISIAGAICCVGCAKSDEGRVVAPVGNTTQTETARLQNNAHMPPQARQAAIQGMQQGQRAAQQAARH
jgi:hypothetical protein